jgi:hypothetical protein
MPPSSGMKSRPSKQATSKKQAARKNQLTNFIKLFTTIFTDHCRIFRIVMMIFGVKEKAKQETSRSRWKAKQIQLKMEVICFPKT